MINRPDKNGQRGFTLPELVIVVAIACILTAIFYPMYVGFKQQSRRLAVQQEMIKISYILEKNLDTTGCYNPEMNQHCPAANAALSSLSDLHLPGEAITAFYDLSITATATSFRLTATPKGEQLTDECQQLSLDQAGNKFQTGARPDCWQK